MEGLLPKQNGQVTEKERQRQAEIDAHAERWADIITATLGELLAEHGQTPPGCMGEKIQELMEDAFLDLAGQLSL
jgi:hypothetical protein